MIELDRFDRKILAVLQRDARTSIAVVTLEKHAKSNVQGFLDAVAGCPEITECLSITGDGDCSLRVICQDLAAFSRFLMDVLMPMPAIATTRSSTVLESLKDSTALPVQDEWSQRAKAVLPNFV